MRRGIEIMLIVVWGGMLSLSFYALMDYHLTPSSSGDVPKKWPETSSLSQSREESTMVITLHPHCACSRATVAELERLAPYLQRKVILHFLFAGSSSLLQSVDTTELWQRAAKFPGAFLHRDQEGVEAAKFGTRTSGHVVLYSPSGARLFHGGVTASRGHEGDNRGVASLRRLFAGRETAVEETPVFGCHLEKTVSGQPRGVRQSPIRVQGGR